MPAPEKPKIDEQLLRLVDEALSPLDDLLKKPKVRQILERDPAKEAIRKIGERLDKDEAKKVATMSASAKVTTANGTTANSTVKDTTEGAA